MTPIRAALALLLCLPALPALAADLEQLQHSLLRHGFTIEVQQPSGQAYGRFIPAEKRLEISPLVQDLGITRPVLLHEAVHAAQSCPSGTLSLLGIKRQASPVVESRIRYLLSHHYPQAHGSLEQEAFRLQSQPDAEALIIAALNQRCQPAEE